ncbi:MAG: DEAD/DEAH box helicase family protein, partial [Chlamydiia bacterium]|nr:DEAD/DEAH box helicase family protein [Chlamydiia bacterium]
VSPSFSWNRGYEAPCPLVFGSYTYVPSEGFCEIPFDYRLPEAYVQKKVIKEADELYFVFYELELLSSHILSLQKELKKPKRLDLHFKQAEREQVAEGLDWMIEAEFVSEWGSVPLFSVWQALHEGKKYLFSPAGCIVFNNPRFNWLKTISKKQWRKESELRLSALEWFRLSAFESIEDSALTLDFEEVLREGFALNLDGFTSELRAYQEMGVKWLWSLFMQGISGLLCDEMGLGKTHQAMGLLAAVLNREEKEGKVLIVCPTSVIYHWEALLQKFLPKRKVVVFYGITRSIDPIHKDAQILLTSYGTLRSEASALSEINFVLAIFDELQFAKNVRSQTHKALKKMKARMRLGLTGTPIENRLLELKAIFDLILPGYFASDAQFKELFIAPIEKYQDSVQKALLSRLVKPFILRRKKSEVLLELPEKIEEIAYCDLSPCQKELYRKVALQHKEPLLTDLEDETKHVPYIHIFSLLSHLKQICDHPCLMN